MNKEGSSFGIGYSHKEPKDTKREAGPTGSKAPK